MFKLTSNNRATSKVLIGALICLSVLFSSMFLASVYAYEVDSSRQNAVSSEYFVFNKRDKLPENYMAIYDKVFENVDILRENHSSGAVVFDFSDDNISFSGSDNIYIPLGSLLYDYPELEWINPATMQAVCEGGKLLQIKLFDGYTNARIWAYYNDVNYFKEEMNEMNSKIDEIIASTKEFDSEYDKLLYFHDWIVTNNIYNYYVANNQNDKADKRAWNAVSSFVSDNDYYDGPVCESYAEAFKILCDKVDIPCVLISGMEHEWNAVMINDEWYGVDCTWDDSRYFGNDYKEHTYFMVGSESDTGNGYTYGTDHIPYTSANPTITLNKKGLAKIEGINFKDVMLGDDYTNANFNPVAVHITEEIAGEFTYAVYEKVSDKWNYVSDELPVEVGEYKVEVNFENADYEAYLEGEFSIKGEVEVQTLDIPKITYAGFGDNTNELRVNWEKVDGAKSYRVAIKNIALNKWFYYNTTSLSKDVQTSVAGRNYIIKIRAIDGKNDSAYTSDEDAKKISTLFTPTITKASTAHGNPKTLDIAWEIVDGATGYRVAIYNYAYKKYYYYETTKTNFQIATAVGGRKYKVVVSALSKNDENKVVRTDYSSAKYITTTKTEQEKLSVPTITKASTVKGNPKTLDIAWEIVDGATGYRVAIYNYTYKKYYYYETTKTNFQIATAVGGRKYKVVVSALSRNDENKVVRTDYSSAKYITTLK